MKLGRMVSFFCIGLVICLLLIPAEAKVFAAIHSGSCGSELRWYLSDGELSISGTGRMENYHLASQVPWYSVREQIKAVIIKDGVTTIGTNAFSGCKNLTAVSISDSVTRISTGAFSNCESLTSITIPKGITKIEPGAFYPCFRLGKVLVDKNNQYFSGDNDGFLFDKEKTKVILAVGSKKIPEGITTIGKYAFANSHMRTITLPDSVTTIEEGAFYSSPYLTNITIGNGVTDIGEQAFYCCSQLTGVTLGGCVANIGDSAFEGCFGLTNITIPNSVTTIGRNAFGSCRTLTEISIPAGVTTIGDSAFAGCTSLSGVWVNKASPYYSSDDYGVLFNKEKTQLLFVPARSISGSYTIPDGVICVADSAFYGNKELTAVVLGDSVTTVGAKAFYNCANLTTVTIGQDVTMLGQYAFAYCDNLSDVYITNPSAWCKLAFYDAVNKAHYGVELHILDANGNEATEVVLDNTVTAIPAYAFFNCIGMTSVTMSDSVTSIGDSAFAGCTGLTSVTMSDSVTSIGDSAFKECTSLLSVTIPDSVTTLERYAFAGCYGLRSVKIGHGVTKIGDFAFELCKQLTYIELGNSVNSIGGFAFSGCLDLYSITIPDSVTTIKDYAFENCVSLTHVQLGDGITAIASGTFSGCGSLASITIPESVASIEFLAFCYCTRLSHVYYAGSASSWNEIDIGSGDENLNSATISYRHNHNYTTTYVEETCTEDGYILYACDRGDCYKEIIPAIGHEPVEMPATEPTCTQAGITAGEECVNCALAITGRDAIAVLGHDYTGENRIVPPTCTEYGYTGLTCSRCGETEQTNVVAALGHMLVEKPAEEPTCTQNGWTEGVKCERCEYTDRQKIAALGHSFADDICTVCGAPERAPGDLDDTEGVTTEDVIALLLSISMPDIFPLPVDADADFTGDGMVTTEDAVQLLLHISMPDEFPLTKQRAAAKQ